MINDYYEIFVVGISNSSGALATCDNMSFIAITSVRINVGNLDE